MARKLTTQIALPFLEALCPVDPPESALQDSQEMRVSLEALDGSCYQDDWLAQWISSMRPATQNASPENNRHYRSRQQNLKKHKSRKP